MTRLDVTATVIDLGGNSVSRIVRANVIDQAYRDSLASEYGIYRANDPDAVGVIRGIPRTTVTSLSLVPGTTYRNLDIATPYLLPPAGTLPIIFRNCRFLGPVVPASSGSTSLVVSYVAGHAPLEFYDCTLDPQAPSWRVGGIAGFGFKAHRASVLNVVDGFSTFNTANRDAPIGVEIYGSWVRELAYWPTPPDTSHTDGSHADGHHIQGGTGYVLRGNYIDGRLGARYGLNNVGTTHANAAIMISPNVGNIAVDIQYNHLFGGGATVNVSHKPPRMLTALGTISNNRFGRDQYLQGGGGDNTWAMTLPTGVTCMTTGNVYDDTGRPITVRRN
jgi:hypothetical protein